MCSRNTRFRHVDSFSKIAETELDDAILFYNYEAAGLGDEFLIFPH